MSRGYGCLAGAGCSGRVRGDVNSLRCACAPRDPGDKSCRRSFRRGRPRARATAAQEWGGHDPLEPVVRHETHQRDEHEERKLHVCGIALAWLVSAWGANIAAFILRW